MLKACARIVPRANAWLRMPGAARPCTGRARWCLAGVVLPGARGDGRAEVGGSPVVRSAGMSSGSAGGRCSAIASETAGRYPGDGSNLPNGATSNVLA